MIEFIIVKVAAGFKPNNRILACQSIQEAEEAVSAVIREQINALASGAPKVFEFITVSKSKVELSEESLRLALQGDRISKKIARLLYLQAPADQTEAAYKKAIADSREHGYDFNISLS